MIELKCPRCGFAAPELIECESCKIIGCIKCITKKSDRWICEKCRDYTSPYIRVKTTLKTERPSQYVEIKDEEEQKAESALAAMFG